MAKEDDLIDEAFLYLSEKKYPDGSSATRNRIIREKAEKFVIVDGDKIHINLKYYYYRIKNIRLKYSKPFKIYIASHLVLWNEI